jgi:hypothetical protein
VPLIKPVLNLFAAMKPHFACSVAVVFFLVIFIAPSLILSYETTAPIDYNQLDLPAGVVGPESKAFDCQGKGPYVGVSDGRILKWQGEQLGWTEFAIISAKRSVSFSRI